MNDRIKRIGKAVGGTLSAMGTALNDGPIRVRLSEIDKELDDLELERDYLFTRLVEPMAGEKARTGFDPSTYRKRIATPDSSSDGRLTECKGRWSATSTIHDAHPGCPYLETKHNAHEFTLRD